MTPWPGKYLMRWEFSALVMTGDPDCLGTTMGSIFRLGYNPIEGECDDFHHSGQP